MDSRVRRAAAFAAVSTVALSTPVAGPLVAVPFALIAVIGRTLTSGSFFDLFATPEDRARGELRGLVGFSLAATGLALLSSLSTLPPVVFSATVLVVGFGGLGERLACARADAGIRRVLGFTLGGASAAILGLWAGTAVVGSPNAPAVALLAIVGALLGALFRTALLDREDPVVMVSVALSLWVLSSLPLAITLPGLAVAVVVAGGFGLLSWVVGTASLSGMLTGVVIATLIIVVGGFGWFAVLLAFAGLGGLASMYRYEEKRSFGVAEGNEGARGGRNVLGNAAVALLAVLGFAGSGQLSIPDAVFRFAFAGSLAAAMSDTLSSEIGVLFGSPRLITTLERVDPGTDGGVTLGGTAAGVLGAAVIAAVALALLDTGPVGALIVTAAGVAGMLADSVFGATIEGGRIGNQGVNFLATLVGALLCVAGVIGFGLVP